MILSENGHNYYKFNMDKFLLAENPFRPEQSGLLIIHMLDPIAIIKCELEYVEYPAGKYFSHYSFKNADNVIEEWTLSVYHLFTTQLDSEKHDTIVSSMIDRAWRWYRSSLQWEDNQIDQL